MVSPERWTDMLNSHVTCCRLFGIPIQADGSWLIIVLIVTWSLSGGFFPSLLPAHDPGLYWILGFAGALGLFASILLHECAHAVVARRYGLPVHSIRLFIFGGVASLGGEPSSARSELLVALAGPLASAGTGIVLFGAYRLALSAPRVPAALEVMLIYLWIANLLLGAFNLIPALPLDGGRVLRALVWWRSRSLLTATKVASISGQVFGVLLIAGGAVQVIRGGLLQGLWLGMMGLFVRKAAGSSYAHAALSQRLRARKTAEFLGQDIAAVPADTHIDRFFERWVSRYGYDLFPVVDSDGLTGCISPQDLETTPRERWSQTVAADVMRHVSDRTTITPGTDALTALRRMRAAGLRSMIVAQDGRLFGIVTAKDILEGVAPVSRRRGLGSFLNRAAE